MVAVIVVSESWVRVVSRRADAEALMRSGMTRRHLILIAPVRGEGSRAMAESEADVTDAEEHTWPRFGSRLRN